MNAFAAFSSPMGPIHFATPASSSALLRIPFFSKPKSTKSTTSKTSSTGTEKSAPVCTQRASIPPPSYREATADAQELEDADVESEIFDMYFLHDREERITEGEVESRMQAWDEQRRSEDRERVAGQDRAMGAALASMGL